MYEQCTRSYCDCIKNYSTGDIIDLRNGFDIKRKEKRDN